MGLKSHGNLIMQVIREESTAAPPQHWPYEIAPELGLHFLTRFDRK